MKRIFIFSECFFPGYKIGGIGQSMLNLVKNFDSSFEFFVLAYDHEFRKSDEMLDVVNNSWTKFLPNTSVYYISDNKIGYSSIRRLIVDINPDFIYLNGLYEINFVIYPIIIAKELSIKVIQAPRGMLHKGALKLKPFKKNIFLTVYKLFNFHKNIQWHATDWQEMEDIRHVFGMQSEVHKAAVMPNIGLMESLPVLKSKYELNLITISLITEKKNYLYILELLSEVGINIKYHICGPINDVDYWNKCLEAIKKLPENITVIYHGSINPLEVDKHLQESHFFILPTLGENFGHSIFEALKCGIPLIISEKTPWRNLSEKKAGWDIPLEEKDKFLHVLNMCYKMDQDEYNSYSEGASNLAKKFIEEEDFYKIYNKMFE